MTSPNIWDIPARELSQMSLPRSVHPREVLSREAASLMAINTEPRWTVDDVASYLGIPVKTLYKWRTQEYGPIGVRIGKHIRYDPEDVRDWFNALKLAS